MVKRYETGDPEPNITASMVGVVVLGGLALILVAVLFGVFSEVYGG